MSPMKRQAMTALAVCFLVLLATGGSRHAIGLVMKPMAEGFGWGRSTLGTAVAVFLCVSAVCMFVSGRLSDRLSPRLVLGGGLLISAIGIGSMSFITEAWHAFVLYGVVFAIGNGVAAITPVGVMITRLFPARAGLANAFAISGMGLGQLIIISGLAAVLVGLGWRSVFLWLGVVNLALLPVLLIGARGGGGERSSAQSVAHEGMSFREALATRRFWALLVIYALCGFEDFFVSTHVVAFAQDQGVDALLAGNLLALMGLAGLIGVIGAGIWSDRAGPIWPTLACFVLRIALFGLILVDKSAVSVAAFALLFGLTFWVTAPLTVIFVRDAFGVKDLGALTGFVTMVHHICGGIGALVGAALFDADGTYQASFAIMLASAVAVSAATLMLARAANGRAG